MPTTTLGDCSAFLRTTSLVPQDRVEVVTFAKPGKYLVICGFTPHFLNDNMHGFVQVLRSFGDFNDR